MAEKFKRRKGSIDDWWKSRNCQVYRCWNIVYSTCQTQHITCLLCVWMRLLHSLDTFNCCTILVQSSSQTHSNEKPNEFKREIECIWMRNQTHLNKKLNAFEWQAEHVCMRNQTSLLKIWNALKQDSIRLLTESKTRSKLSNDIVN